MRVQSSDSRNRWCNGRRLRKGCQRRWYNRMLLRGGRREILGPLGLSPWQQLLEPRHWMAVAARLEWPAFDHLPLAGSSLLPTLPGHSRERSDRLAVRSSAAGRVMENGFAPALPPEELG